VRVIKAALANIAMLTHLWWVVIKNLAFLIPYTLTGSPKAKERSNRYLDELKALEEKYRNL
jgi:hypothetical protein